MEKISAENEKTCCCNTRILSLCIGWFQIISCVIFLLASAYRMFKAGYRTTEEEIENGIEIHEFDLEGVPTGWGNETEVIEELKSAHIVVGMGMTVLTNMFSIVAGIVLIAGVKKASIPCLKIWIAMEVILTVFGVVTVVFSFLQKEFMEVMFEMALIILCLIFIVIVNAHRNQIMLDAATAHVQAVVGLLSKV